MPVLRQIQLIKITTMKRTLLTILSVLFCAITFAQSVPQGINYQAVARDATGDVLMNQNLTIRFSVISDITTANVSWQETHPVTTNDYGLFTAIIGDAINGTSTNVGSSATFDSIDWGASNHLLKVEIDYGSGYVDMGTTAFMSVPYSMNASNVDPTDELQSLSISGDTIFISDVNYIIIPGISLINSLIVNGCTDSTAFNYNASANTDDGSCIAVVNGCTDSTATNYNALANTDDGSCIGGLSIGDTHQGGIIFYLDSLGGGLIAAPTDQFISTGTLWGCYGTLIAGADGTAIGTGAQNTIDILAGCATSGTAADICANLTIGAYSDWFLPSKDELNEMYLNIGQGNDLGLGNIGGFANHTYWSSTEYNTNRAWMHGFDFANQGNYNKAYNLYVRAVRAFAPTLLGCTDSTATNYNALANTDDGSCIIIGCTDSTAANYNPLANTDDGSCIAVVLGCIDSTATNYNALANTDDGSCTYPLAVGDTYQGGIIFYLDSLGGGLISAPTDQFISTAYTGTLWGCDGTLIAGADGTAIGTGAQNTIDILAGCATSGTAADICANLTIGTYSDWFLPSKDELNLMYLNIGPGDALGLGNIGGFSNIFMGNNTYWSSTEYNANRAWMHGFDFANQGNYNKAYNLNVRAVRAF